MSDDKRFDASVSDALSELPLPGEVAAAVTPWKAAADRIAVGLVLTTFTLNLLYLQYLLPTIGVMLLYLGFRSLRKCSGFFAACWVLSIFGVAQQLWSLLCAATPLGSAAEYPAALTYALAATKPALLLLYHLAVKNALKTVGEEKKTTPLLGAFIWYLAAIGIALSPYNQSWLPFIAMVIFYVVIIKALIRLNTALESWGYAAECAPVRLSAGTLGRLYALAAALIVLLGGLLSNTVRPDYAEAAPREESAVYAEMTELGFPEYILADMSAEDVESLAGTVKCTVFDESVIYAEKYDLRLVTVYAEKPGGETRVTAWFCWENGPALHWQDAVKLYGEPSGDGQRLWTGEAAGRLLYEKKGVTYAAEAPSLELDSREYISFFGDMQYESAVRARVGYPVGAENARGYLMLTLQCSEDTSMLWTDLRYCRQNFPLGLPWRDSRELPNGLRYETNQNYSNMVTMAFAE